MPRLVALVALFAAAPLARAGAPPPRPVVVDRLLSSAGVHRFDQVETLRFTFNVERDGKLAARRRWLWRPRTGEVTLETLAGGDGGSGPVTWSRRVPRERWSQAARDADRAFVNDTFWLLPALHLSWAGDDVALEDAGRAPAPGARGEARRLVVRYAKDGGGYTPGDVYELFVDGLGRIVAWHFRRGGAEEPTLTTTFEGHERFGPLRIALEHRSPDGRFRLYFSDVSVEADDEIRAAVGHPARPADDRARDATRHPADVLYFCDLRPGARVADLMAGDGYYTEILARAVLPAGRVYAQNNGISASRYGEKLAARLARPGLENVVRLDRELEDPGLPSGALDAVLMFLFYHDTYWMKVDRAAMLRRIHDALVPGGVFCVSDHHAAPGAGTRDVKTLHRVELDVVKREILAAGFVLEASGDRLRNPADDRTRSVFDEAIRGRTDRFLLRFRKPAPPP